MNNVKKYINTGAILAVSALMVSCDGDDGDDAVVVTDVSSQNSITALAVSDVVFNTHFRDVALDFDAVDSALFAADYTYLGTQVEPTSFVWGQFVQPLGGNRGLYGFFPSSLEGVVPSGSNVVTAERLVGTGFFGSSIGAEEVTVTDFVFTEIGIARNQSYGTFSVNFNLPALEPGFMKYFSRNGADRPEDFDLSYNARESRENEQPSFSGGQFVVAVGDVVIEERVNNVDYLFIADAGNTLTEFPDFNTIPEVDVTAIPDVTGNDIFVVVRGAVNASTVTATGSYVNQ